MSVHRFTHDGNRGQGAAADTGHPIDTELPVRRRPALFYLQFPFEIFENYVSALDMTGGPEADFDRISAGRIEAELIVKSRHTINL